MSVHLLWHSAPEYALLAILHRVSHWRQCVPNVRRSVPSVRRYFGTLHVQDSEMPSSRTAPRHMLLVL